MPAWPPRTDAGTVSVPFDAGRGLMRFLSVWRRADRLVSVPFDAGRGLMQIESRIELTSATGFSTLRCGSWIDAQFARAEQDFFYRVSVPFDAGRGLMLGCSTA